MGGRIESPIPSLSRAGLIVLGMCVGAACSGDRDRAAIRASIEDTATDPLVFYATQSPTTDPGEYAHLFYDVSSDVAAIVGAVQGVLIQIDAVEREGPPSERRRRDREVNLGTVRGMLKRIHALDKRPLTEARAKQNRLVSICAQYALLTTALLRHHGIPARSRGGFETHFSETKHHDHWITEYWDAEEDRWVRVDAEIDEESQRHWGREINGQDLPEEAFVTGAEAWRLCRVEGTSPTHFGIWGGEWIGGWDFVLNELLLDFNALNKVESLPWDETALGQRGYARLTACELSVLDQMAEAVLDCDNAFERLRDLFRSNPELRKQS